MPPVLNTPYCNSIALAEQPQFPGNLDIEARISALVRWNALAMVVRANRGAAELGGHIATYASAADLFEVGFNHFFRAGQNGRCGVFPAARRARRLCARLARRPPERSPARQLPTRDRWQAACPRTAIPG
jgi:pyruvate dehydrogenase complex dehydrogenase (E1) component